MASKSTTSSKHSPNYHFKKISPQVQAVQSPRTYEPYHPTRALKFGHEVENFVLRDLQKRGCEILGARFRTPFAEIDLFFRSAKGRLVLLEVKSLSQMNWIENRISQKQKERLLRAAQYLGSQTGEGIQICAAFVRKNKIRYFEIL